MQRAIVVTCCAVAGATGAVECKFDGKVESYLLEPWGNNSVRVRVGASPHMESKQQALLPQRPQPFAKVFKKEQCTVTSGNLEASFADGRLTFALADSGKTLLKEISHDVCSKCTAPYPSGTMAFDSFPDERIYGLGEHRTGKLDNKGIYVDFMDAGVYDHHQGSDIVLPYYVSSRGFGFLWNKASFGSFNSTDQATQWTSMSTPLLDFWVTTSGSVAKRPGEKTNRFKQIQGQFADATGHPPEMPEFATGFWQCKNRYRNQEELMAVAREYKKRKLPISTIVIDYLHWDHFGDFSLNQNCWPDPAAMVKELDSMDIRVMVSIWPFVQSGSVHGHDYNASGPSVNFQAMYDGGMLVRDSATGKQAPVFKNPFWESNPPTNHMYVMDPFNPDTRAYVFQRMKENYMKYGIKTFWLDEAEPERHVQDINIRYGYNDGTDAEIGLAWSRAEQQMVYEGLKATGHQEDDIFMLSRSFFVGGARYGAGAWSGDIPSTFKSFHEQVRVGQNVAMSGIHWWTTDIGGYSGGSPDDPVMKELLIRWFQFGAFCPLFRLHGDRAPETITECGRSGAPVEVWHYGDEAYKSITAIMKFRESLRPYVSATMKVANQTGVPALRPLFLEFPDDQGLWEQGDKVDGQFMFGPDYLVSPVTEYNATSWQVYLPTLPGDAKWIHYYTATAYVGGKVVEIDVSDLNSFPLFKRSDASLVDTISLAV